MDDLFKKVESELRNVGSGVVAKSKELTNSAKQNASIASEQLKIKEQYKVLGELFYKLHKDDCEEPFQEAVSKINESKEKIKQAKQALKTDKVKVHKQDGKTIVDVDYVETEENEDEK